MNDNRKKTFGIAWLYNLLTADACRKYDFITTDLPIENWKKARAGVCEIYLHVFCKNNIYFHILSVFVSLCKSLFVAMSNYDKCKIILRLPHLFKKIFFFLFCTDKRKSWQWLLFLTWQTQKQAIIINNHYLIQGYEDIYKW